MDRLLDTPKQRRIANLPSLVRVVSSSRASYSLLVSAAKSRAWTLEVGSLGNRDDGAKNNHEQRSPSSEARTQYRDCPGPTSREVGNDIPSNAAVV